MAEKPLKNLKINKIYLFTGLIILSLGYLALKYTPMAPTWEMKVFAWNKMIVAPILLLSGYLLIGVSIFKSSKN